MEQIFALLLTKMEVELKKMTASQETDREEIRVKMKTNQKKMEIERDENPGVFSCPPNRSQPRTSGSQA
jgi:hypothetical protein